MKTSIGAKNIIFPTPVFIVGTYGEEGKPNAMNVAWAGICGSSPPSIGIAIREQRCTYKNIMNRKAFTINIPSEIYIKEADYFDLVSGNKTDKFSDTGLTPIQSDKVDASYIEEFPFNAECELIETLQIGEHTLFVGQIIDIKVDADCIDKNDLPDIEKIKPLLFDPAAIRYNTVGKIAGKAFSIGKRILSHDN
ncbi:flavin reductase family protein [Clostridium formicaceticum]|uniref:Flavoredoxin n=1 Tax=Clostridium formicaceticum TaxID=1497 RepID=A0AAC9RNK0_9CLOT|nr:flavin reductase family protein [Clostridium formicaceticum]AOY77856.1 flavoredoxin [Clostridium formicaceticum]ARE88473.1 Flavoredoxin [Clostridium formicaceticum]